MPLSKKNEPLFRQVGIFLTPGAIAASASLPECPAAQSALVILSGSRRFDPSDVSHLAMENRAELQIPGDVDDDDALIAAD
jgi:hypothetical protein